MHLLPAISEAASSTVAVDKIKMVDLHGGGANATPSTSTNDESSAYIE